MPSSSGARTSRATRGRHAVEGALDEPPHPGELRLLDVQQRKASHRPDVDARPCDVGERRRDDEVDAGPLEVPGQPPQVVLRQRRPGADGDGVGAADVQGPQHVVARLTDRFALDLGHHRAVDADSDDVEAGVRLAASWRMSSRPSVPGRGRGPGGCSDRRGARGAAAAARGSARAAPARSRAGRRSGRSHAPARTAWRRPRPQRRRGSAPRRWPRGGTRPSRCRGSGPRSRERPRRTRRSRWGRPPSGPGSSGCPGRSGRAAPPAPPRTRAPGPVRPARD